MRLPALFKAIAGRGGGGVALPSIDETHPSMQPIFLLGVGRCGSTYLQTILSRLPDIWIWGENDGIAPRLMDWADTLLQSRPLNAYSFAMPRRRLAAVARSHYSVNDNTIAWLNGFRPADIVAIERELFIRLFSVGLPNGKTRWGFKEIRHGPHDKVAERLLQLFPCGRVIHTVRHPIATIESSIAAWHTKVFTAEKSEVESAVAQLYGDYAKRWNGVTRYYLDLERALPEKIRTCRIEHFAEEHTQILSFIGSSSLSPAPGDDAETPINRRKASGAHVEALFAPLRQRTWDQLAEIAGRLGYDR